MAGEPAATHAFLVVTGEAWFYKLASHGKRVFHDFLEDWYVMVRIASSAQPWRRRGDRSFPSTKGFSNLSRALDFIAVQIDRGGRDGGVAQIVAHGGQFRAAREGVGGVRMSHPMRTRFAQLLG
jgi:hypothetical protein